MEIYNLQAAILQLGLLFVHFQALRQYRLKFFKNNQKAEFSYFSNKKYIEPDVQNMRLINGCFRPFLAFFFANYLHEYLSQNLGSDVHYEVLNLTKF